MQLPVFAQTRGVCDIHPHRFQNGWSMPSTATQRGEQRSAREDLSFSCDKRWASSNNRETEVIEGEPIRYIRRTMCENHTQFRPGATAKCPSRRGVLHVYIHENFEAGSGPQCLLSIDLHCTKPVAAASATRSESAEGAPICRWAQLVVTLAWPGTCTHATYQPRAVRVEVLECRGHLQRRPGASGLSLAPAWQALPLWPRWRGSTATRCGSSRQDCCSRSRPECGSGATLHLSLP